eukprot:3220208-Rhodomonas_salina.1
MASKGSDWDAVHRLSKNPEMEMEHGLFAVPVSSFLAGSPGNFRYRPTRVLRQVRYWLSVGWCALCGTELA